MVETARRRPDAAARPPYLIRLSPRLAFCIQIRMPFEIDRMSRLEFHCALGSSGSHKNADYAA